MRLRLPIIAMVWSLGLGAAHAAYVNFESSHVHPIALSADGARLAAVNTPDATLEVFAVDASGWPSHEASIPVGLEPVSVVAESGSLVWVANHLSDTVSIVDLERRSVVKTLFVGDEPSDVAFARGKAFVAVSQEDAVKVYDLADLDAPPSVIDLFGEDVRALAVASDASAVYAVVLRSGNQTTVLNANIIFGNDLGLDPVRLAALGLNNMICSTPPPPYPPLPPGIIRNPTLTDPLSGVPPVALIVRWNEARGVWEDEDGQDWNDCLPYRLPDHDLFVIDSSTLAVREVDHLGTTLFEVSVNPANGRIYVPHTEARNFTRFEHALGLQGHMVDNRLAVVDPAGGYSVTTVELNTHIDPASDPAANLAERSASISQPGMLVWRSDGSRGYLTAIGSRKLFAVDGSCLDGGCIFGTARAAPDAVEVGEGPTGVALNEAAERLYVLNRFSNSIALVDATSLTKLSELALNDTSSATIRQGRRLLYDAIDSSAHGDSACSTCHISGDMDGLAWDLGDPTGDMVLYTNRDDNVRFVLPSGGVPVECAPAICASHQGFDPQKGPMATQTLRGMLEPLHWRGDRPTFNDFNPAFVGLMGKEDIGPIAGKPAGLTAVDMELFSQFALDIRYPPNPSRNPDDSLPDVDVTVPGSGFAGNPSRGETIYTTFSTDAGQPCVACHEFPFGTAGGKLGGVTPTEPTSPDASALFNGNADLSPHNDLKISHLRNIYEKLGPRFGDGLAPHPEAKSGFGLVHDGSIPDLLTFFSDNVFTISAAGGGRDVRDVSSFVLHYDTGTKPAVGQHITVPAGTPPTGSAGDEGLLALLMTLGDLSDPGRHCDLIASAIIGGEPRSFYWSGGVWISDKEGEPSWTTSELREAADEPVSFLCVPEGDGERQASDRDEDGVLNGDDCGPSDAGAWDAPAPVTRLKLVKAGSTVLAWDDQSAATGPSLVYDVVTGLISELRSSGLAAATACLAGELSAPGYDDSRPAPAAGEAYYYLVSGRNTCASGVFGPGRGAIDGLSCR